MEMGVAISEIKIYVRIPAEAEEAIRLECARRRVSKPKLIAEVLEAWLAHKGHAETTHSGEAQLTKSPPANQPREGSAQHPAKDPGESLGELPDDVVSLLRSYWSDPEFRASVLALGVVWGVGDSDIKDSLARNCRTFARSSEMVEVLKQGDSAELSPFDRERVERLLAHADRIVPKALRGESVSGGSPGSTTGGPEVGGGSIPPRGRKQK